MRGIAQMIRIAGALRGRRAAAGAHQDAASAFQLFILWLFFNWAAQRHFWYPIGNYLLKWGICKLHVERTLSRTAAAPGDPADPAPEEVIVGTGP